MPENPKKPNCQLPLAGVDAISVLCWCDTWRRAGVDTRYKRTHTHRHTPQV